MEIKYNINQLCFKIFYKQKTKSKQKGLEAPNYTKEQLRDWMVSQYNFKQLYYNWIFSGCKTELIPSCDRLDDYKPYTLDNLRLVTWKENNNRYKEDAKKGKNRKACKAIIQIDKENNIVNEFFSIKEAERKTKIQSQNIWKVCKNIRKYAGGFKWEYKDFTLISATNNNRKY